jgi:diguanylate cyclase (GGDEF)-like protein/PAS domain S-box-containing protein
LAALLTLLAAIALLRLDNFERDKLHRAERDHTAQELNLIRSRLVANMTGPLLLTRGVAAQIIAHGDVSPIDFNRVAKVLIDDERNVHNIVVSRGTVIAMVYPLAGNAKVIGADYRTFPDQWPAVEYAINSRRPVLDGPIALIQGGSGLIVRDPVFLSNPKTGQEQLFGIVSVVLNIPTILAESGLDAADLSIQVAIQTHSDRGNDGKFIYGDEGILHRDPIQMEINLPYGPWRIAAIPTGGWTASRSWFSMSRLLSGLLFLFVGTTSFGTAIHIMHREQANRELQQSQKLLVKEAARFQSLLQNASDGIHILDMKGNLIEASDSFSRMLGYTRDQMNGMNFVEWDVDFPLFSEVSKMFFAQREITIYGTRHRRKDGSVIDVEVTGRPLEVNDQTIFFASARDITERKNAEKKIHQLAFFDQLTDLPNRTLFLDRLKTAIAANVRSGAYGALLYIDLDNFKTLNDTLGHQMGDLLLKQVAQRLKAGVRAEDTVARLGGDEFLVMAPNFGTCVTTEAATHAEALAEKLLAVLNEPYQLDNTSYHCTPSIGVILFCGHDATLDDLLKQADLAMYKAKAAGRNAIRFFNPSLETVVKERAVLEADLREAIREKQFQLHYQAQVENEGHITGAECLVRWQHPQRGLVSPAEFIPLAEETGLILPLGQWVLETACSQLAAWSHLPELAHLTVAVNVSALQFRQADFVNRVLAAIETANADPRRLKLELTESLLVENVPDIIEKMFALKAKGVSFSLDDFGTGYSSLSYLKRLPLDQLKIDLSFVQDALIDPSHAVIVNAIVALAHNLGLSVIAEGVETAEQRDFLSLSGCHSFQGYFFSRPLPLASFERYCEVAFLRQRG